jgi:hypothetical protein
MPYAFLEGQTPVEIVAGAPFITPEIVVSDDDGDYYAPRPETPESEDGPAPGITPLASGTVLQVRTLHPRNALDLYGPEDLARYRIQQFAEPQTPVAKIVKTRDLVVDSAGMIGVNVIFEDAPAPDEVTLLQLKVSLLSAGKLEAVEAAVASAEASVRIYWQSAGTVRQTATFAAFVADAAGETVEAMFLAASLAEI